MVRLAILAMTGILYGQVGYEYFLSGNAQDVKAKTTAGVLFAGGGKDVDAAVRWFLIRAGGGEVVVLRASGTGAYNPYF